MDKKFAIALVMGGVALAIYEILKIINVNNVNPDIVPSSPSQPTVTNVVAVSANTATATFTWGAVSGATYYKLNINGTTGSSDNIQETSVTVNNFIPGQTYQVSIVACNSIGCSLPGPFLSVAIPQYINDQQACIAAGGTWVNGTCQIAPITNPEQDCINQGGTWSNGQCTFPPNPQQQCIAAGGQWVNNQCVMPSDKPASPGAPSLVNTTNASPTVSVFVIKWDAVAKATYYKVVKQDGTILAAQVFGTSVALQGYPNSPSTLAIVACNTNGCSSPGPYVTFMTAPYVPPSSIPPTPSAPRLVSTVNVNATTSTITIAWDPVQGATYYKIVKPDGLLMADQVTNTSVTFQGYPDSPATFGIKACNTNGCSQPGPYRTFITAPYVSNQDPTCPSGSLNADQQQIVANLEWCHNVSAYHISSHSGATWQNDNFLRQIHDIAMEQRQYAVDHGLATWVNHMSDYGYNTIRMCGYEY